MSSRPFAKKNPPGGKSGRPKGSPNKTTAAAREAIAKFVDKNAHRLQKWLDEIANGVQDKEGKFVVSPDPEKAFQMFQSVIEYHVPKLARTEVTANTQVTHYVVEVPAAVGDQEQWLKQIESSSGGPAPPHKLDS